MQVPTVNNGRPNTYVYKYNAFCASRNSILDSILMNSVANGQLEQADSCEDAVCVISNQPHEKYVGLRKSVLTVAPSASLFRLDELNGDAIASMKTTTYDVSRTVEISLNCGRTCFR